MDIGHPDGAVPPPDASPSAAVFGANTTVGKIQETEVNNTSGNTYITKVNMNLGKEALTFGENSGNSVSDPIATLNATLPLLLTEIRKIQFKEQVEKTISGSLQDQDQLVDGETTRINRIATPHQPLSPSNTLSISENGAVDISDIVPSDPSSLPVPISIADKYTRTMLKCLAGYPLYKPKPYNKSNTAYLRGGVRPGDVGFFRENGAFDFLFNICPSQDDSINPPTLPIHFTLQESEDSEIYNDEEFSHDTHLYHHPVCTVRGLLGHTKYKCSASEGAILELPEGATRFEVVNRLPFKDIAKRCGVEWYGYIMSVGRDITNGSLYLVTSTTKCTHWGIAVVERPCPPWESLQFCHQAQNNWFLPELAPKYSWDGSSAFTTTLSPIPDPSCSDVLNQCVFLRGYKIRLREDVWNGLDMERHRGKSHVTDPSVHPS